VNKYGGNMDISTIKLMPIVLKSSDQSTVPVDLSVKQKTSIDTAKINPDAVTPSVDSQDKQDIQEGSAIAKKATKNDAPSMSPAQAILKRLGEQIAEIKEKIAELEAQLTKAIARAGAEPSPEVDSLRNQLEGLQNQLTSLTGAYNDAINEINKTKEPETIGSIIDISQ